VIRNNNFDSLRLIGALLVLVGHASPLTKLWEAPEIGHIKIYRLGVLIFFSISGYLITASWFAKPKFGTFFAKRALRLFPALVAVVLVSVFVIGPVFTTLKLSDYFANSGTWQYLALGLALVPAYKLPGVFASGHPNLAVNGSLWTLGLEFACYAAIAALGALLPKKYFWIGPTLWIAASAILLQQRTWTIDASLKTSIETAIYFGVGSLLYLVGQKIKFRGWFSPAGLSAWLIVASFSIDLGRILSWVLVPVAVIAFAKQNYPLFRQAARFGDISYGIYLWAFPVQQVVIEVFGFVSPTLNVLLVVGFTVVLALLSWHLIEKRALTFKPN
jgi:peptidoglycan/LPS O-acetylase OafA/YrhL